MRTVLESILSNTYGRFVLSLKMNNYNYFRNYNQFKLRLCYLQLLKEQVSEVCDMELGNYLIEIGNQICINPDGTTGTKESKLHLRKFADTEIRKRIHRMK